METRRLYDEDAYLRAFDAEVLSCEKTAVGFEVTLDQTAFYPGGGGQVCDTGTLSGVAVQAVFARGGTLIHRCDRAINVGAVHGEIDFPVRFERMQLHSGEHLVSGLIHQKHGYENVGFHMGKDRVTIDISGVISGSELCEIERLANEAVFSNIETEITVLSGEALDAARYRSKKKMEGHVRLVTVPGVDCCACCGTHVKATGEIGIIKLLSAERFRAGVRIEMLCGRQALSYLNTVFRENHQISALLSAPPLETAAAVERLVQERDTVSFQLEELRQKRIRERSAALSGAGSILLFEKDADMKTVQKLSAAVMETCGGRAAIFSGSDAEGYHYAIGEKNGDIRKLVGDLNAMFGGRGGGKPCFAQGFVSASRTQIETFFKKWSG